MMNFQASSAQGPIGEIVLDKSWKGRKESTYVYRDTGEAIYNFTSRSGGFFKADITEIRRAINDSGRMSSRPFVTFTDKSLLINERAEEGGDVQVDRRDFLYRSGDSAV